MGCRPGGAVGPQACSPACFCRLPVVALFALALHAPWRLVATPPAATPHTHAAPCRVGWSTQAASLDLGTDKHSFGYGGTGKKSHNRSFDSYGEVGGAGAGSAGAD